MMRAVEYVGSESVIVGAREVGPPGSGQVQIAVAYVGICGTDLHIIRGHMDSRISLPAVIGHEMSGTVSAVGEGVTEWRAGDHVTVMPLDWDGSCPACAAGNEHICQNLNFVGIDSPGALQRRWNVSADLLVSLPKSLGLLHAALVEPTAVAVHDVRRAQLQSGETAVIIGGGPIGVLIASVAREWGGDVVVIEIDPQRRVTIEQLGFTALDPNDGRTAEWIEDWTEGAGADVVFEVSGSPAAVLSATDYARVRGRLVVVAIHPEPRPIDLQRVFWRELTIIGARVYRRADFDTAVDLLDRGVIPADALITSVVPLDETQAAFATLASGHAMKILVDVQA